MCIYDRQYTYYYLGLNVTTPTTNDVVSPGQNATITVSKYIAIFFFSFLPTLFLARVQNDYQKTITGVDVSLNIKMWIYYSNLL